MGNPLFTGLIAYVVREMEGYAIEPFKEKMQETLEDLYGVEDLEDLDWFDDLQEHWLEHMDEDEVDENLEGFKHMVSSISPDQLLVVAVDLRNEIMLESLPDRIYKLESFRALYFFKWQDGLQIEYSCRPIIRNANFEHTNHFIGSLNDIFRQQLVEMLISPGLDAMHDQVARPFELAKFNELLSVMYDYINKKPANEREPFEQVIGRIKQCFGPGPRVQMKRDDDLEWLDNGGGF